jgi:hypothetical protein
MTTTTNTVSGASGGDIGFDVDPSKGRRAAQDPPTQP